MSVVRSTYSILSNKPLRTEFSGAFYEISFDLPFWFVNWNGKKIIKVYGCSFNYLESENKVPKISTKYLNQFVTVHSNIVANDTENLISYYPNESSSFGIHSTSESNNNYMMVANNYYTPKIYDLTHSDIQQITIWFKGADTANICLRGSCGHDLQEIEQAVFKIECELAILD